MASRNQRGDLEQRASAHETRSKFFKRASIVGALTASLFSFTGCELLDQPGATGATGGILLSAYGVQQGNASAVIAGQGLTQYGSAIAGRSQTIVNIDTGNSFGTSGGFTASRGVQVTPFPYRMVGYQGIGGVKDPEGGLYTIEDLDYAAYNMWGYQLQAFSWEDSNGNGMLDSESEIKELKQNFIEGERIGFRLKSKAFFKGRHEYRVVDSRDVTVASGAINLEKYVQGYNRPANRNLMFLSDFPSGVYNLILDNRLGLRCDCPFSVSKKN